MTAITIRQVGPYTITCDDGDVFCNGVATKLELFTKPMSNGAMAVVDTHCKGTNGMPDMVSLQPDQIRLITAAQWARNDREQAEYNRTHAAEIAALNDRQRKADIYDRGMNEGGEGFNSYRESVDPINLDERQVCSVTLLTPAQQRERDAAEFEDWSEWRGLVVFGSFVDQIELRPVGYPAVDLTQKLPGAKAYRRHRYDDVRCYLVPILNWRAVRAALPEIAAKDARYKADREVERRRLDTQYRRRA